MKMDFLGFCQLREVMYQPEWPMLDGLYRLFLNLVFWLANYFNISGPVLGCCAPSLIKRGQCGRLSWRAAICAFHRTIWRESVGLESGQFDDAFNICLWNGGNWCMRRRALAGVVNNSNVLELMAVLRI